MGGTRNTTKTDSYATGEKAPSVPADDADAGRIAGVAEPVGLPAPTAADCLAARALPVGEQERRRSDCIGERGAARRQFIGRSGKLMIYAPPLIQLFIPSKALAASPSSG